jgi:hypothetical protein
VASSDNSQAKQIVGSLVAAIVIVVIVITVVTARLGPGLTREQEDRREERLERFEERREERLKRLEDQGLQGRAAVGLLGRSSSGAPPIGQR